MRSAGFFALILYLCPAAHAADIGGCANGARTFLPCELSFDWQASELPAASSGYTDDVLNVEFRSPTHTTYLMHGYWSGGRTIRVRFSPTEPGSWTYRISSSIKRYDDHEDTFSVSDSGLPGFVNVANLRHWRSTNKQPHLWFGASAPFLTLNQNTWETWLDARKHDGFNHVRGTLLSVTSASKPFDASGQPNLAYFAALDDKLVAAITRGFTLDLLLADDSFLNSGAFKDYSERDRIVRYLVARYGGLNVTWQGIPDFEGVPNGRALLKDLGAAIKKYDGFHHPLSTDARVSSSPLLPDGWMNYLIESSPHPELGAVEHQFTEQPEIHVITSADPETFRHELWNCTTNGEYPSVSYEALKNEANLKVVQTWFKVMSDTRHWEFEPYFDVSGARSVGLNEVEYLAYAEKPGIVEITLPKHKYNPSWINPATGEEIPLKDYRGEVFSRQTPDSTHDWLLSVPREGQKASMLKSYYFESQDPPVQEVETDATKTPFDIVDPPGNTLNTTLPPPFQVKITRPNRATRHMEYVWWGEVVATGEGARVLGVGPFGNFAIPPSFVKTPGGLLNVRLCAINANGKAYEIDKVYQLTP